MAQYLNLELWLRLLHNFSSCITSDVLHSTTSAAFVVFEVRAGYFHLIYNKSRALKAVEVGFALEALCYFLEVVVPFLVYVTLYVVM